MFGGLSVVHESLCELLHKEYIKTQMSLVAVASRNPQVAGRTQPFFKKIFY